MSNSTTRRELELLAEALSEVPVSDEDGSETASRLNIDVKAWAASVRARVAAADAADREARFDEGRRAHLEDHQRFAARKAEPLRPVAEQQAVFRHLVARVPPDQAKSMHFLKFEEVTSEQLAEAIRALRHLLGDNEE